MRGVLAAMAIAVASSGPLLSGVAVALPPPAAPATDDVTERARKAFVRGQKLAREDQQWGDALAAFQEAASLRDAPLVEFNIGYCERALGRYVAARRTLQPVAPRTTGLDPSQVDELKAYLEEFDRLIVRVAVQLEPANATLLVDGRPLVEGDAKDSYLAGVAPAGAGAALGKAAFTVLLDPGAHLFRAVREGHQDAVVPRSYHAGESATLDLHLDVLPATIAIKSDPASAIVTVDAREVGLAPIEFQRPAGQYKIEVVRDHYQTYKASLDLAPGQRADLTARLNPYTEPLTKKWWFWTGAAVVVAGGAVLTYFVTRSPQTPAYDAGSANWLVHAQGVHF